MKQLNLKRKTLLQHVRVLLCGLGILLLIVTAAMFVECVIFQFPALRYKSSPVTFSSAQQDEAVTFTSEDALAELTDEEVRSIEVERDNERLLAEYNGEEYEVQEDETLVEQDGVMYRKVKKTTISVSMEQPYYIHKLALYAPVTESAGYSMRAYLDGKLVNDNVYCTIEPKIGAGIANVSTRADRFEIEILSSEELAQEDISITISNSFRPNAMRIVFMVFCLLVIVGMIFGGSVLVKKPEYAFALICLMLGGLLICGIGTNQVGYDEHVHAKAAYKLSFGSTIETTETALQMVGNLLPTFHGPEERALIEAYENENNDFSWADIGHQSRFVRSETRVYYPMAVGFWIGRELNLSFAMTVALAKFGNLICYILVVFFAIRLAERYKNIVAFLALLPNCVFLASSLTYDAVVNSFLLLGMVLVMNELTEPERKLTWQNTLLMLFAFAIGCQSKPIYIVMVLLMLFAGRKKFENRWQEVFFKAALLVMAGLMIYNIFFPTPSAGSDYYLVGNISYAGDKRNVGTSVLGQIAYIFGNPLEYTKLLLRSMAGMLFSYLNGASGFFQYGYLGSASTVFTYVLLLLAVWASLTHAKGERRKGLAPKYIVLTLLMVFGVTAIIWTSMYVSYTSVGADEIRGVQGRYFIPLFFPLLVCLMNSRLESRLGRLARNRLLFGSVAALNLFMIYTLVIQVMNV